MATATTSIAAPITNTQTNLEKVESFINDPLYKEVLESAMNFNTRLCIERRLRLPFIDTQTGVAQNHSSLFMHRRQRIPGLNPGQIYSYPRPRWRKKRRQYLSMNNRSYRHPDLLEGDGDIHSISQIENPALQDTDSKDSQLLSGEASKDWFYDDPDILEMENYDEPDADSDLDYEESYTKRKRGRKTAGRGRSGNDSPSTPGRKRGSGRGRGKKTGPGGHNYEPTPGDPDKPFACELCGARYKTRPGLTYHYGHSHKEGASEENSRESASASPMNAGPPPTNQGPAPFPPGNPQQQGAPVPMGPVLEGPPPQGQAGIGATQGQVYQDSYVSFLNQSPGTPNRRGPRPPGPPLPQGPPGPPPGVMMPQMPPQPMMSQMVNQAPPTLPPNLPQQPPPVPMGDDPPMPILKPEKAIEVPNMLVGPPPQEMPPQMMPGPSMPPQMMANRKVPPSPYCDFCLGDSTHNKKTGGIEELVSCHDCGRSGHPTCLQFTENMKVSVKKYRWQCIECKCCSVCGTSDNDDQLLFCDDCDRGYHMYCLMPPLENPPEGSWSCKLCILQFHHHK